MNTSDFIDSTKEFNKAIFDALEPLRWNQGDEKMDYSKLGCDSAKEKAIKKMKKRIKSHVNLNKIADAVSRREGTLEINFRDNNSLLICIKLLGRTTEKNRDASFLVDFDGCEDVTDDILDPIEMFNKAMYGGLETRPFNLPEIVAWAEYHDCDSVRLEFILGRSIHLHFNRRSNIKKDVCVCGVYNVDMSKGLDMTIYLPRYYEADSYTETILWYLTNFVNGQMPL